MLSIVLIVIGVVCLCYYAAGVSYAGFGASFIWIWLAGGIVLMSAGLFLRYARKHELHPAIPHALRFALLAVGILFVASFLFVEGMIVSGMTQKQQDGLDYLIVLGAQVKGEKPSKALTQRMDRAIAYLSENPGTKVVVSGGKGPGEEISEAEAMSRYMTAKGIKEDRIIREDQSTDTSENLKYSFAKISDKKAAVGLVTHDFHVFRSCRIARHLGYRVSGISASSRSILQPHYFVREYLAVIKDTLQGNMAWM